MRTEIGALLVILLIAAMLGFFLRGRPQNLATSPSSASHASSPLTTAPQGGCSDYSIDGVTLGMECTSRDLRDAHGIDESLRVLLELQADGKEIVTSVRGASLYRGTELMVKVGDSVERLRVLPLREGAYRWGRRYDLPVTCMGKASTTANLSFGVNRDNVITVIDMRMRVGVLGAQDGQAGTSKSLE